MACILNIGRRVGAQIKVETVLDAFEADRSTRGKHSPGVWWFPDAGSQFTSIRYDEHLTEIGAVPSIGSVGDSFDDALAQTMNGHYKAELIRGPDHPGRWKRLKCWTGNPGVVQLA